MKKTLMSIMALSAVWATTGLAESGSKSAHEHIQDNKVHDKENHHMGPTNMTLKEVKHFYKDLQDLEHGKRTDGERLMKDYELLQEHTYWYKTSPDAIVYELGKVSDKVAAFRGRECTCKERYEPFEKVTPLNVRTLEFKKMRAKGDNKGHKGHKVNRHAAAAATASVAKTEAEN